VVAPVRARTVAGSIGVARPDLSPIHAGRSRGNDRVVDESTPAVELPGLYRAALDGIARLERLGERRVAARIRGDAIAVYSGRWDERGRRRLHRLVLECERLLRDHPRADRLTVFHTSSEPV
jgi:hypothetical protein